MLTGNKGEWGEVYALLKILADKKLYAGDAQLNRIENIIYPIIKVLRDETQGTHEFHYDNDLVVITAAGKEKRIAIAEFQRQAYLLLDQIKNQTQSTFSLPEVEQFMQTFGSHSLKAKSSRKTDIRVMVHDFRTGMKPELGFSIKSQIGSAATLLNAGKTTNFICRISSRIEDAAVAQINAIDTKHKIRDRMQALQAYGLRPFRPESKTFENNLTLIDSALPRIVAEALLLFYRGEASYMADITEKPNALNPLAFDLSSGHRFYEYKLKRLLVDVALGMMPAQAWNGQLDSTGGYLIVKQDGDVVCYHIYSRNDFENYLFANTKLDTASSSKHDFGQIYQENDEQFFKLNLQIRFI